MGNIEHRTSNPEHRKMGWLVAAHLHNYEQVIEKTKTRPERFDFAEAAGGTAGDGGWVAV
jgi:hypothetical protein